MSAFDFSKAVGSWKPVESECSEHGRFTAFSLPDGSIICPKCHDAKRDEEAKRRFFEERRAHLRNLAALPNRFANASFGEWAPASERAAQVKLCVMSYYRDIRDTPRQWHPLWLTGLLGTGKTHLLCALANNLCAVGISARYTTLASMLSEIKDAYSAADKTEAGQIAKFANSFDLLVIDEIDVMRATDNDKALLFAVINGRYNDLRAVAIASNQSPDSLGDFVTDRVVDRLRENSVVLVCDWASARSERAA
ncbi:ATP-binding protein [Niveibacterium terrae]|uniref:ATP-binding protein n=1 Tax=Niveibacterium terrae TaxID=3373598 RepID=UPI003A92CCD2